MDNQTGPSIKTFIVANQAKYLNFFDHRMLFNIRFTGLLKENKIDPRAGRLYFQIFAHEESG